MGASNETAADRNKRTYRAGFDVGAADRRRGREVPGVTSSDHAAWRAGYLAGWQEGARVEVSP